MRRAGALLVASVLALLTVHAGAATGGATAQVPRWNASQIDLGPAQPAGHDGAGVTVAVLDTWIDAGHPDFGGRVLRGATCRNDICTPGGTTTPDGCEAHGTHVAGIIASSSYGVAPLAKILPVRVLFSSTGESGCVANSSDVAAGVRWAAAHGARVINISLGEAYPVHGEITALAAAVDSVSARGVLVVAAAGNQAAPVATSYGTTAIVVAATGPDGRLAGYSQRGAGVRFAAPGGDPGSHACTQADCVVSTWGDNEYAALAGTSMAAAHVSGLAALLLGQDPARTRSQVIGLMARSARPLADAGYGLIDAAAALGVASRASPFPGGAGETPTAPATGPSAHLPTPAASHPRPTPPPPVTVSPRPARAVTPPGRAAAAGAAPASPAPTALDPLAGVAAALLAGEIALLATVRRRRHRSARRPRRSV